MIRSVPSSRKYRIDYLTNNLKKGISHLRINKLTQLTNKKKKEYSISYCYTLVRSF